MNGRNLDYGSVKSDSREGSMAKSSLMTMAKDLYQLYCALHDEDDLPQWCHYKLAKSQNELQAVTNYLTSKIAKTCAQNDIALETITECASEAALRNIIQESLFSSVKDFVSGKRGKEKTRRKTASLVRDHKALTQLIMRSQGEYRHLKDFYRVFTSLIQVSRIISLLTRVKPETFAKLRTDLRDSSRLTRLGMMTSDIKESVANIKLAAEHLMRLLNTELATSDKSNLLFKGIKGKLMLAGVSEAVSLSGSNKDVFAYNELNQAGLDVMGSLKELERYDASVFERGLANLGLDVKTGSSDKTQSSTVVRNISDQIKALCSNDKLAMKTFVDFLERIIVEVLNYCKLFEKEVVPKLVDISSHSGYDDEDELASPGSAAIANKALRSGKRRSERLSDETLYPGVEDTMDDDTIS